MAGCPTPTVGPAPRRRSPTAEAGPPTPSPGTVRALAFTHLERNQLELADVTIDTGLTVSTGDSDVACRLALAIAGVGVAVARRDPAATPPRSRGSMSSRRIPGNSRRCWRGGAPSRTPTPA